MDKKAEGHLKIIREKEATDFQEKYSEYADLQGFVDRIATQKRTKIKTGFEKLDELLGGGLRTGLYVVGGMPALGKTTFISQIADQMAAAGHDVMIFSMERSKYELIAKSISREVIKLAMKKGKTDLAKRAREIVDYEKWKDFSSDEIELIQEAVNSYANTASNIFIRDDEGRINTNNVNRAITRHIEFTGKRPVVIIIDKIQFIALNEEYNTEKQALDNTVRKLKRISNEFEIPVVCISMINRQSYNFPVTMESFKETGGIEYLSDVVIGLNLSAVRDEKFDINRELSNNERCIELSILKNRNGETRGRQEYRFYTEYNIFLEKCMEVEYER